MPDDSAVSLKPQPVYLVDGLRTPFLKGNRTPGPFSTVDLATHAGRALLLRQPQLAGQVEEVILGCAAPQADAPNPARDSALRMGLASNVPAFSVQRNCGSGMQAIDTGFRYIQQEHRRVVLAGGAEAMSRAALQFDVDANRWLAELKEVKSVRDCLQLMEHFRPGLLRPKIGLEEGLTDQVANMSMGETAELLAQEWGIRRETADAYALQSHRRLKRALDEGWLRDEIEPVFATHREAAVFDRDTGLREDTDADALAKLPAAYRPPYGQVTAGNSSQITDGACWVLLASAEVVEEFHLEPLGEIVDSEWVSREPERMGLAPASAVPPLLQRNGVSTEGIDLWELNEAFAAQVLSCLAAWEDESFCREQLNLGGPFGHIDPDKLNVDGGAISLGHPVGASGARIVLHALNALRREGGVQAVATECIGGGQAGAMLLRRYH